MSLFNQKDECRLIENLLNPAVEEAEINRVEGMMNCVFPDDFRSLYMKHNGEGDRVFGVMAGFSWMTLQSVMDNWRALQDSAYDIISDKSDVVFEYLLCYFRELGSFFGKY